MKNRVFPAWLLAILCCINGPVLASQPASTDEEAVVQAIRLMYVALTNEDPAQLRAVTTADFYAFDGGKNMTGDELLALIKGIHAGGRTIVWNVTEPRVRFEGKMAWITYLNRGYSQDAAGKKDVSWLESAVLQKEKDTWRLQFFHSTRVPAE
jgi:hypothetical protein